MDVLTRFTGERCGIDNCRSRRYHRADDGLVYCQNGHQSSHTFETQHDDEYLQVSQSTSRARPSSSDAEQVIIFFERGDAVEVFLNCFQYILQKQVQWVTAHTPFVDDLENVVRDLWTLQLQLLEDSVLASSGQRRGPQVFSSQLADDEPQQANQVEIKLTRALDMLDGPALLYLGCMLLQLPVSLRDVLDWIESHSFPFLTASSLIPDSLFRRLPLAFRKTFQVRKGLPDPGELHTRTMRHAAAHGSSPSALQVPSLNFRPVLFKLITALSLPLDLYPATVRLNAHAHYSFCLPSAKNRYMKMTDHPEIQLLSLLVVAVKLIHPFDSIDRLPRRSDEPAAMKIDWRQWNKLRTASVETSNDRNVRLLQTREVDVLSMDGKDVDEYLDWFQQTWIHDASEDSDKQADFRRELGRMFPAGQVAEHESPDKSSPNQATTNSVVRNLHNVQGSLQHCQPVGEQANDTTTLRPGSRYHSYKTIEDVPEAGRGFLAAAAQLGALSVEQLMIAVLQTETRLNRRRV